MANHGSDLVVWYAYEGKYAANGHLRDVDKLLDGYYSNLFEIERFTGKADQVVELYPEEKLPARRLLLVGLGKKIEFSLDTVRQYGGNIGKMLLEMRAESCTVFMPETRAGLMSASQAGQALVEGITLGAHGFPQYKSDPDKVVLPKTVVLSTTSRQTVGAVAKGVAAGEITAAAQVAVRELVAQPAMTLTPTSLSQYAQQQAAEHGVKCTVLSVAEIKKLRMNCLIAVSAGSDQPAKFIVLEYKGPKAKSKKVCLVGKGITFDSGGYCLKDPINMLDMKGDMAGSACVITAMMAASRLNLPVHVVGLIPTCENMVSGRGYKPGDVLTAMNGKTIEVINTDAEGRLILADALCHAASFKPEVLVDVATLTGAAEIAFGFSGAALFASDDRLADRLLRASELSGERAWRMPLWIEYQEYIKSELADIKNSAGKVGSLCTSAAFLANFTEGQRWAHLDIAGMDNNIAGRSYLKKGASGFGARLLIEFLRNW
jgi:leucyl aminopeptidase